MKSLITAKIDRKLKAKVTDLAKADGRSASNMIERLLSRGIEKAEAEGVNTVSLSRRPRCARREEIKKQ